MHRAVLICLFCLPVWRAGAEQHHLLPKPQRCVFEKSVFLLDEVELQTEVLFGEWQTFVLENGGKTVDDARRKIQVRLVEELKGVPLNQREAYTLVVGDRRIEVEAVSEQGVYWALQTLRQLCVGRKGRTLIQGCRITDWPAFRIRGFMHDVGRGYISMEELKREIAVLSRFKVNVFHWHLTDNQAWRLESRIFPMLNDSANMERLPGKYYTLAEARELVEFCRNHNILLIPEIEMPGHSAAFVRTFRHDMQSPEGMKILKLLLDEVCETFDVPYLHIGTDEVSFSNPDFVPEIVGYVRSRGKKVISWNPGWHYLPGQVDMTQLWSYRGRAQAGIPAIDSRFHYLNHFDTFGDIVALYRSRIYDSATGSDDLAGVILAVWNDRMVMDESHIILENNFYPNMLAMAERAWRGGGAEYFDKNGVILPTDDSPEFQEFVDFERRMLWHKSHSFEGYPFAYVRQTNVKWKITDPFPNEGQLDRIFPPEKELRDVYTWNGKEYHVHPAVGAGIYLRHVWGDQVPAFYPNPRENHTGYAYTWVFSPKEQEVGMWIEFQNYGRSEMDLPPLQGTWDYKGSRIWLNDEEILPPEWSSTHSRKSNEIALGNENCIARPPKLVTLRKGWNKLFLKLPVGKFSIPEVRLVKWMFTAVFVTPDGQQAVDGLIYSPEKEMGNRHLKQ